MARTTKQKELMETELEKSNNFESFFTAEEFHKKLINKNKNIGIATVYRFLKDMQSMQKIHSYTCDRKTIYSTSKISHSHFLCEKCGKKKHIRIKNIDFIKSVYDGKICHFQIDVHGICEECCKK